MKFAPAIIAAATLAFGVAPLAAKTEKVEVRISHADLDLTNPDDYETMKLRIVKAAKDACSYEPVIGSPRSLVDDRCVDDATARAFAGLELKREQRLAYKGS